MSPSVHHAAIEGADLILCRCGRLQAGEMVVIVCDAGTLALGQLLESRARLVTARVQLVTVPEVAMHGEEPPSFAADAMAHADLCLGIRARSMAHTNARRQAGAKGARYLSLPDYSMDLLADASLRADYEARGALARQIADRFTTGSIVSVTSRNGTDVTLRIDGRVGNCCPGYVAGPGELGSPPDIEANVSPIETSARGTVVVDGSVPYPGLGLLEAPITLTLDGGRIEHMDGPPAVIDRLRQVFESARSPKAYVLAECGVGLNDKATLTGVMLTDEGAAGTMHFGFGSNATVGGVNDVAFHLDVVFREPSLAVDGVRILERGQFVLSSAKPGGQ